MVKPAAFVDRDGTILVQETGKYLTDLSQAYFEVGALDGLVKLGEHFGKLIIITNQAGVYSGAVREATIYSIHEWIKKAVEKRGGHLDGLYFCPHSKNAGCSCRKPGIGMYERAIAEHQIDVARSVGIGDTLMDIEACLNIGVHPVLVLTGEGRNSAKIIETKYKPFHVTLAPDLYSYAYGLDCQEINRPALHSKAH